MWLALAAMGLLVMLSVLGAFCGAEKAKHFFSSIPLKIYWCAFAVLLAAGFIRFPQLLRKPPLILIHIGCLLVLTGGMWGSEAGHQLARRFLGIDKIPGGYMVIYEGHSENRIVAGDLKQFLGQLPFSIKLKSFRLEYYEGDKEAVPQLYMETQDGQRLQLVAKAGEEISLGEGKGKLKVVRTFTNFKIRIENGEKIVTDEKGAGQNPAVEVEIERSDGTNYTRYVFERFAGHFQDEDGLQLSYASQGHRTIRDYFSDVTVVKNEKEVAGKTIEVNHPLHYGGYHFYQYSYDLDVGQYTVLSVTSDSGLYIVYTGYWMLSVGVLWQFWLRAALKAKRETGV